MQKIAHTHRGLETDQFLRLSGGTGDVRSGDYLRQACPLPDLAPGALLALMSAGAYGYAKVCLDEAIAYAREGADVAINSPCVALSRSGPRKRAVRWKLPSLFKTTPGAISPAQGSQSASSA